MIEIFGARFVTSASNIAQCPPSTASEIVMLGRSNVGKSTLINKLLGANLAKSSSTPGKTRLINFFYSQWRDLSQVQDLPAGLSQADSTQSAESTRITESTQPAQSMRTTDSTQLADSSICAPIMLIDLPGIGYAKVSKEEQRRWERNLWDFLQKRSSIKLFLHLIDARHPNMPIDSALDESTRAILRGDQRLLYIYTKGDKLKKNDLAKLRQKKALIMSNHDTITPKNPHHHARQMQAQNVAQDVAQNRARSAESSVDSGVDFGRDSSLDSSAQAPRKTQPQAPIHRIRKAIFDAVILGEVDSGEGDFL
ncbi:hypothetical protein BKN38_06685 [Helicobacter sp. CLO-3]|nr:MULTISPECIES: GTPase [unclassified Helicobacter]OBV28545.1 hypothetical protein BA723_09060 [Helicobacter sp. CLO-3]OHU82596.1 hypothetical protein BKN38_06685 [Helicobacter sp. CLO-3]